MSFIHTWVWIQYYDTAYSLLKKERKNSTDDQIKLVLCRINYKSVTKKHKLVSLLDMRQCASESWFSFLRFVLPMLIGRVSVGEEKRFHGSYNRKVCGKQHCMRRAFVVVHLHHLHEWLRHRMWGLECNASLVGGASPCRQIVLLSAELNWELCRNCESSLSYSSQKCARWLMSLPSTCTFVPMGSLCRQD